MTWSTAKLATSVTVSKERTPPTEPHIPSSLNFPTPRIIACCHHPPPQGQTSPLRHHRHRRRSRRAEALHTPRLSLHRAASPALLASASAACPAAPAPASIRVQ